MNPSLHVPPSPSGPSRPSGHAVFAALVLVAVMAAGLWQASLAVREPAIREVPATLADFREGRTTNALEREIEKQLPWRKGLVTAASAVRYVVTRGAGDQVRLGRDDWLFLADELRFHPGGEVSLQARVRLLEDASRALGRRGVLLLVVLVPDKARVHAVHLSGTDAPKFNSGRYGTALESLRARGVAVVDLLAPLGAAAQASDVYYRSDTHWNQRGAQVAARAIAETVKASGIGLPVARFRELTGDDRERVGDLIRLMGLEQAPAALRPPADRERPVSIEEIAEPKGAGLFGDANIPVVLVGTSYSMRASFHGFLQQALEARVLNASMDGAGFLQSAGDYLANDAFREAPPRILLWEIPERFLDTPLGDERGWVDRLLPDDPPAGSAPG